MRTIVHGGVALAVSLGAVVGLATAAQAKPNPLTFCGTPSELTFADIAPTGESTGDLRVLKYTLTNRAGKQIGTASQVSTLIAMKPTQDALARVTFRLPKGTLIVEAAPTFLSGFLSPTSVPVSTEEYGVILGGTGAYKGAGGSMTLKVVDPTKPLGCWTADFA